MRLRWKDVNLPDCFKDKKELSYDRGSLHTAEEEAVVHTPPDSLDQVVFARLFFMKLSSLSTRNLEVVMANERVEKEFESARDSGENKEEEHKTLPAHRRGADRDWSEEMRRMV